ncbi:MAG TPA: glutamate synthase subunit beta [Spirochaetales bacterium]|nr:glutamate synthase subunit beta [Spirochaetales bacterium]
MGKPTGFMEYERRVLEDISPEERLKNYREFHRELDEPERIRQGARCMDCGVPFCQSSYGCPLMNLIPEWNDFIYQGRFEEAFFRLRATNNFPEFTGRVCPAPCETACVLGIHESPVTIKNNECFIIDRAYETGLMVPRPPKVRTGKKVAVVGSGPAGLAAADQLNQAGHLVTVFERADQVGGLLMYGIPNMKLDKNLVLKRVHLMELEGVEFRTNSWVGREVDPEWILEKFDAVVLSIGATVPRDMQIPGRNLGGIHFALEFLTGQTKQLLKGSLSSNGGSISAAGKNVVVIGGGDTGNDCIGTALRHGCVSLKNFELLPKPPKERTPEFPWPLYPRLLKVDYGHEEAIHRFGSDPREWSILSKEFLDDGRGNVRGIRTIRVEWMKDSGGKPVMKEIPGSEEVWKADLVLLALGFLGPEGATLDAFGVEKDNRSTIRAEYGKFVTSNPKVFAAGDGRRGQSLVVWAIHEGRKLSRAVDTYLEGESFLP